MKTFTIGDIHGAYKQLLQCLQKSQFNYETDQLIVLGDVCDGWPQTFLCYEELLKIKHLTFILGNHDFLLRQWAIKGIQEEYWMEQGGSNTLLSYQNKPLPPSHITLLQNALPFYELNNKLFVHGGFDPDLPLIDQSLETFTWDRTLIYKCVEISKTNPNYKVSSFDEIFVGHTPTFHFGSFKPLQFGNLWAIDTGAGWQGVLTIMNVDSKEYWQSDPSHHFYPNIKPRSNFTL